MNPAERLFLERYITNPGRNLLRFSFVFMILGIVLSVGILSAALNLFEGYERALKAVLLDSFPHIRIQTRSQEPLTHQQTEKALRLLHRQSQIASANANLSFNLMAANGDRSQGVLLRAFDLNDAEPPPWSKYVIRGKITPSSGEAVVGHYLAQELGLAIHDTLRLIYPQFDRITPLGMYPGLHEFEICGLYRSGYYEYDRSLVITNVADAQAILGLGAGYSGIEIKLKPQYLDQSQPLALRFDYLLGTDLTAEPVANVTLLRIVRMQKWLIFIIFSFLVLIAGINVISCVLAQIYDKKNEIAVLKALGTAPVTLRNILGHQLTLVCLLSVILGQFVGLLLSWLVVKQNFYQLKGDVYFIDRLELYVSPVNQLVIFLVAAILVLFCVRLPLRRTDRMLVIDLLRNP